MDIPGSGDGGDHPSGFRSSENNGLAYIEVSNEADLLTNIQIRGDGSQVLEFKGGLEETLEDTNGCSHKMCYQTRRVPIHCMYDIRNGQPIWCKVENVIHNFGHHAVEIDENRIFIMDVHQTVLITELYQRDRPEDIFCRICLTEKISIMKRTQGKVVHSKGTVWNNKLGYSNVQMGWRVDGNDGKVDGDQVVQLSQPKKIDILGDDDDDEDFKSYTIVKTGDSYPLQVYHRKPQKPQIGHNPGIPLANGLPYYPNQKYPQIEASKDNIGIPPPGLTRDNDHQEITNPNFDSNYNFFVGFILIMWTSVAIGAMAMGKHRRRNSFYYFNQPLRFISDIIDYLYQITRPRKRKHSDTILIDEESPQNQPTKLMLSVPSLYTGLYQPKQDNDNNQSRGTDKNELIQTPNYRKFEREYTADKILGKGGFGLVFQVKRKGDGQLLALKRIKVKNSNHKTKVWREAKLHAYLTENDVNYDHLIQYFDAWEERIDPEAIKQHDQPFIDTYNVVYKEHTEILEDSEMDTEPTSIDHLNLRKNSKVGFRRQQSIQLGLGPSYGKTESVTIDSLPSVNSVESWAGSDSWSDSTDDSDEENMKPKCLQEMSEDSEDVSSFEIFRKPEVPKLTKTGSHDGVRFRRTISQDKTSRDTTQQDISQNDIFIKENRNSGLKLSLESHEEASSLHDSQSECSDMSSIKSPLHTEESFDSQATSGSNDIYIFVVSQLCEPETLKYKLQGRSEVDEIFSKRTFLQIVKGVKELHKLNLIHRDLKPANIFFSRNKKTIKIGDFGLMTSTSLDDGTNGSSPGIPENIPIYSMVKNKKRHTSQIGTKIYMAPEMKKSNYSLPVDIYSLGVILFELFSLFSSHMDRAVCIGNAKEFRFHSDLEIYKGIPDLIRKMLQPNPLDRPTIEDIYQTIQSAWRELQ